MTIIRSAVPVFALAAVLTPVVASAPAMAGQARVHQVTPAAVRRAALVGSVSCSSAGNCGAGGFYYDASGHRQGFVVSERRGVWGRALEVPGLGALNAGGFGAATSMSCASAGNCAAVGYYQDSSSEQQGFVVDERNGVWGQAIEVPGLGALNAGALAIASVFSVSCSSAGNCAAGGSYSDSSRNIQGFVVAEKNGVWGQAIEVPGLDALNSGNLAQINSVSCTSPGNCGAGGSYMDRVGELGFVVDERNGVWGQAIEVPGLAALKETGFATVLSVSCSSAGNCAGGGSYRDSARAGQGFVVSERNGVWGRALEVPGLGALNVRGFAQVSSVSCTSAGNCGAGGFYRASHSHLEGFVVGERRGMWGRALEVPALGALNARGLAQVSSVSCGSADNCVAGGFYTDSRGNQHGFVARQRRGVWGRAFEVPGLAALNAHGFAGVRSVSCTSASNCAAGGFYNSSSRHMQGFLVSLRRGVWGRAFEVPGLATLEDRVVAGS